jgi:hypothetical protein
MSNIQVNRPGGRTSRNGGKWSIGIIIMIFLLFKPVLILSTNFFLSLDRLFYTGGILPLKVLWAILGVLVGAIYGAWVAKKKYGLEAKWVWFPIGSLTLFIAIFLLINGHAYGSN